MSLFAITELPVLWLLKCKFKRMLKCKLPVWVLCAHMHLQKNALCEGLEALATLPEVPITELAVKLAGGCGTSQDTLVLGVKMVKARLHVAHLV